ncbi:hypothetical protein F4677DRAFT_458524 [Hypoxylon crocopeplum]|nr:hypothetical protein F4677DRAFT_458524 [Hypoxylon crocopeplum]
MGFLARLLVLCLLALCHGTAMGAVVQVTNKQDLIQPLVQVEDAPATTASMVSKNTVILPEQPHHPFSSRPHPTRTGEDTSRPPSTSSNTSHGQNPSITENLYDHLDLLHSECPDLLDLECEDDEDDTECLYWKCLLRGIPLLGTEAHVPLLGRDDYDGYGNGYGSGSTPSVNGGYGSPPEPTALPPGGYGNPPPPAVDKPSMVTVSDPATVTVTLELHASSVDQSSTTVTVTPPVVTITQTATSTSVPHVPVQNVTVTVTASHSTSNTASIVTVITTPTSTHQFATPPVAADTTPSGGAYVYTTVSLPYSGTSTIMHTPTAHPPPRPVPETSSGDSNAKLNQHIMFVAAALVTMGHWTSPLVGGLALLMASNNAEAKRNGSGKTDESGTAGGSGTEGEGTGSKTEDTSDQHSHSESSHGRCCEHRATKAAPTEPEPENKTEKSTSMNPGFMYGPIPLPGKWKLDWPKSREVVEFHKQLFQHPLGLRLGQVPETQVFPFNLRGEKH